MTGAFIIVVTVIAGLGHTHTITARQEYPNVVECEARIEFIEQIAEAVEQAETGLPPERIYTRGECRQVVEKETP